MSYTECQKYELTREIYILYHGAKFARLILSRRRQSFVFKITPKKCVYVIAMKMSSLCFRTNNIKKLTEMKKS